MGEENVKVAIAGGRPSGMLLYANGQPVGPIEDIQTITLEPESNDEQRFLGVDLAQGNDFAATFSFTPRFPHVSRKQFVRNLKRAGCSKNRQSGSQSSGTWPIGAGTGYFMENRSGKEKKMNVDNRTRLVEEVKAIGQEIIDRAEDIVGEGDLICGLTLMASFSGAPELLEVPTLEITREQYSKNIHKLYMEGKIV